MSKINNIRIINLNYNNNNMRIDDETFYFGGKDTLLNLRNGGGKSVLVQMMMAPLMNKRYRNLKDRTFESYFTTNTPTYILIEWKLDDNAGYVLTGMMVRKRQLASDDDSKDKLEIVNFIHEYKNRNKYDIKEIPFIEIQGEKRSLRNFNSSKSMFENIKKDPNYKFNYYDMNNQSKRYFDTLKEYKIDNKEWEDIIRKINLKESGLSELFSSAKNESGLVKEWLIPAVESKLNKTEDRIKKYNELMDSYIKQYKSNKSKIDSKNKMELFIELSKQIAEQAEKYKEDLAVKCDIESSIANLRSSIEKQLTAVDKKINEIENREEELTKALEMLNYEKISRDIYNEEDNMEIETKELKELEEKANNEETNLENLKRRKNILECAKLHLDYKNASEDMQRAENELQSLDITREEKAPRIKDLGYSIKSIITKEEETQENLLLTYEKQRDELSSQEEILNNRKNKYIAKDIELHKEEGSLENNIKNYDYEESNFNEKYKECLGRNIEGYYMEEALIDFEENINKEYEVNSRRLKEASKIVNEKEQSLIISKKNKEDNSIQLELRKKDLENEEKRLIQIEEQIKERKEILKYIDFSESKIFDKEEIIEAFNRKLQELGFEQNKLSNKLEDLNKELDKLKSGTVLELPAEIRGAVNKNDINILYGMQWLKNNGYSEEKNKKLVQNNNFIPYSLIMDKKDIENLKKYDLGVFTNFPIPIIKREELESSNINSGFVEKENVSFYVAFNENLLDEEELKGLIESIESKIEKLTKDESNINEEIKLYTNQRGKVEYSDLDYNNYQSIQNTIKKLKEEKEVLEAKSKDLIYETLKLESEISELKEDIENIKLAIRNVELKLYDFNLLKSKYLVYKKNKLEIVKLLNSINENQQKRKEVEKEILSTRNNLEIKKELISSTKSIVNNLRTEKIDYLDYLEGTLIYKDKEDLVSEYKALTKNISESEKDIKQRLNLARTRFKEAENNLTAQVEYYNLKDSDYINEVYDISKFREVDSNIKGKEKELKSINKEISKLEGNIKVIKRDLERYYTELIKKFNKEKPLDRSLVFNKDFEYEKAKINQEKKEIQQLKDSERCKRDILNTNKSSLAQYNDFEIVEEVEIAIDIHKLDEFRGKLERDLRNIKSDIDKRERVLLGTILDIGNKQELKDEVMFQNPLNTMRNIVNRPIELLDHLNMVVESYNKQLEKLNTDIELIKEEEENLISSLLEYIEDINLNLGKIDENSTITISNKKRKMLEIIVKDFNENKELYKTKLRDYIESIRDTGISILEENKNIEEYISKSITTIKLYDEVISIDSIEIKLYKVEENSQIKISWSEVSKNSGGEGFLSAFVILSSLLSYTRKDENDIFSKNEGGKVLIMDNPFAQTNAAHLLKPLMDIAKKSNTQLICLSGLGGDSIYNRFDNIYVLNLIKNSLNNKSYLKGDHKKGEEEKETLIPARFNIEDTSQMRLF